MTFRIAVAQFAPEKAKVAANLDAIAEIAVQAAHEERADLLVLPETATSGYFLEGGVSEAAITHGALVSELRARLDGRLTVPLDLALGFYEVADGILYNSAAYLELGPGRAELRAVYRKFFLPTYGLFDEERFVSRGRDLAVFDTRLGRMALLVCEDVWHSVMPMLCAVRGAQTLIVPAASPARGFGGAEIENLERYRRLFRAIAEEHGVFVANAQLVGFEGGKGFVGGSSVTDPFGEILVAAPRAEPHLAVAEIRPALTAVARAQSPLLSDLRGQWDAVRRLVGESEF